MRLFKKCFPCFRPCPQVPDGEISPASSDKEIISPDDRGYYEFHEGSIFSRSPINRRQQIEYLTNHPHTSLHYLEVEERQTNRRQTN